jgi:hypothetical protein
VLEGREEGGGKRVKRVVRRAQKRRRMVSRMKSVRRDV